MAERSDFRKGASVRDEPRARRTVRPRQATLQYPVSELREESDVGERSSAADSSSELPGGEVAEKLNTDLPKEETRRSPVQPSDRRSPMPFPPVSRWVSGDRRTGTMPLVVLLPVLGDLSQLVSVRAQLERRLRALQADDSGDDEGGKERLSEESMLNQVLQWLSLGEEES